MNSKIIIGLIYHYSDIVLFLCNINFRRYELFQESRRICNAIYTHIIYSEYIPAIIGTEFAAAYDLLPRNLDQEKSDRKVRILELFSFHSVDLTANIFESGPMPTPGKILDRPPLLPSCKLG